LHPAQSAFEANERDIVIGVLARTPAEHGRLLAAVVMDDHVHVLARLIGDTRGSRLVQAWKSISAHEVVKLGVRRAPIWQAEYFDRWIESAEQADACVNYIVQNPRRRWPELAEYAWLLVPPKAR
jgi:REP element-mobilizing transposase RayT